MTAEREAMTLEQVRDWLQNCADSPTKSSDISNDWCGVMADAIDAHLSRAAEPVYQYSFHDGRAAIVWRDCSKELFDSTPRDARRILYTHPPEPADAATKALAALGHVRKPNERCTARYAEVPKKDRPPGPASAPVWCCLRAGHDGPHKCSHYGMHPPFVMRADQTVMGDPLPDVCSKCGTRWPCPDAVSVIAAMARANENIPELGRP